MTRRALLLVVVSLAAADASAQTILEQAQRPPPLPPEPGCELWRGTMSGNDPSALVEVRLCPSGGAGASAVRGVLQWSSTVSGWNRRAIEGTWDVPRTRWIGRDSSILEQRPQPGWQFCTADRYDLSRTSPRVLDGVADSEACRDHPRVHLELVSTDEPRPSDVPPTTPAPLPPAPPTVTSPPPGPPVPAPPPPSATVGCRSPCAVGAGAPASRDALALAAVVALGAALARRRARR